MMIVAKVELVSKPAGIPPGYRVTFEQDGHQVTKTLKSGHPRTASIKAMEAARDLAREITGDWHVPNFDRAAWEVEMAERLK